MQLIQHIAQQGIATAVQANGFHAAAADTNARARDAFNRQTAQERAATAQLHKATKAALTTYVAHNKFSTERTLVFIYGLANIVINSPVTTGALIEVLLGDPALMRATCNSAGGFGGSPTLTQNFSDAQRLEAHSIDVGKDEQRALMWMVLQNVHKLKTTSTDQQAITHHDQKPACTPQDVATASSLDLWLQRITEHWNTEVFIDKVINDNDAVQPYHIDPTHAQYVSRPLTLATIRERYAPLRAYTNIVDANGHTAKTVTDFIAMWKAIIRNRTAHQWHQDLAEAPATAATRKGALKTGAVTISDSTTTITGNGNYGATAAITSSGSSADYTPRAMQDMQQTMRAAMSNVLSEVRAVGDMVAQDRVCFQFAQHGRCSWGDRCRFMHEPGVAKDTSGQPTNTDGRPTTPYPRFARSRSPDRGARGGWDRQRSRSRDADYGRGDRRRSQSRDNGYGRDHRSQTRGFGRGDSRPRDDWRHHRGSRYNDYGNRGRPYGGQDNYDYGRSRSRDRGRGHDRRRDAGRPFRQQAQTEDDDKPLEDDPHDTDAATTQVAQRAAAAKAQQQQQHNAAMTAAPTKQEPEHVTLSDPKGAESHSQ